MAFAGSTPHLIFDDRSEYSAHDRILAARALLGSDEAAQRLLDTRFRRSAGRDGSQIGGDAQRTLDRKRAGLDCFARVRAGQTEAQARMTNLSAHKWFNIQAESTSTCLVTGSALSVGEQRRRSAHCHQLQREARERRDRSVLGQRIPRPLSSQAIARGRRQIGELRTTRLAKARQTSRPIAMLNSAANTLTADSTQLVENTRYQPGNICAFRRVVCALLSGLSRCTLALG